jgi:hypothetical protein
VSVVNCVANVVLLHHIFEHRKMRHFFKFFFVFFDVVGTWSREQPVGVRCHLFKQR